MNPPRFSPSGGGGGGGGEASQAAELVRAMEELRDLELRLKAHEQTLKVREHEINEREVGILVRDVTHSNITSYL